jgi:iron(III) transport system substrate-binding protein
MHTLRLQKLGLLEPVQIKDADRIPDQYRASDGTWYGLAARGRVLIVNTELIAKEDYPASVESLAEEKWKGKCGLAKPLFGTTATHAAVLFEKRGDERAKELFRKVKQNSQVMSGNKQVATAVGRGQLAFGLTDTDDAIIEKDAGRPVEIIFPDQGEGGIGTLLIPNTVAAVKGSKNREQATRLIQYILAGEVEAKLAAGESAQIPLRRGVLGVPRCLPLAEVRWMEVDFAKAADKWEGAAKFLRDLFETGE